MVSKSRFDSLFENTFCRLTVQEKIAFKKCRLSKEDHNRFAGCFNVFCEDPVFNWSEEYNPRTLFFGHDPYAAEVSHTLVLTLTRFGNVDIFEYLMTKGTCRFPNDVVSSLLGSPNDHFQDSSFSLTELSR